MKNRSLRRIANSVFLAVMAISIPAYAGGECGGEGTGDCLEPNNTPFCNNAECCKAICAVDPFCCQVRWDNIDMRRAKGPACQIPIRGEPPRRIRTW